MGMRPLKQDRKRSKTCCHQHQAKRPEEGGDKNKIGARRRIEEQAKASGRPMLSPQPTTMAPWAPTDDGSPIAMDRITRAGAGIPWMVDRLRPGGVGARGSLS